MAESRDMDGKEERSFGEMETLRSARGGEAVSEGTQSFGDRETWRSGGGESVPEEEQSFGDRETLREGAGWGIVEEWGGKRWKAGEASLGRYVVERELGRGGMGMVYGCFDKVGGVRVAVKALPPGLSHNSVEMEEVRENFQLVVGLRHPNIAGVRTLEKDGRGEYFLVMDVAEGESLRRWMRRKLRSGKSGVRREGGGVPLSEVLPILRQVAGALDYAHKMGVVHRDVKPGNVMIDGRGEVKVLDFGLAAQIRTSLGRASQAYRGTSGTGPYMAPEQWEGKPQGAKTDQYALAAMAYEMLAGHLPFENADWLVLKDVVLHRAVDPVPGLPPWAMDALRRGLSKRPEERFVTCGEFVAMLGGKVKISLKRSEIRFAEKEKGSRKKGLRGGCMAVLALALAAGAAGVVWWSSMDEKRGLERIKRALVSVFPAREAEDGATALSSLVGKETGGAAAGRPPEEKLAVPESAEEAEARRVAEARMQAEWEELLRQAGEALEETVYRLAPLARAKAENAERMGYDREQGFGARLDAMKVKLAMAEKAMENQNFGKAKEWFEESMASAWWCEEHAPLRKAAIRAKGAAEEAKSRAEALDGMHLGLTAWRRGETSQADAEAAWGKTEFREAAARWNEAAAAYGESEKAARSAKVELGLEVAKGAMSREAWESAMSALDGVLGLEAGNPEAKVLKDNVECQRSKAEAAKLGAGKTKTIVLRGGAKMEMVWCPPGCFMMGGTHLVRLTKGFWMAKTEVTQAQWRSVMGNNPSHFPGDNRPVEEVDWAECAEFCRKAGNGLRLPTEAEWEYACRAGSEGRYAGTGNLDEMGWYASNSGGKTHPVGEKQPNAWGLYDMHGNVWEWCADWYQPDLGKNEVTNPTGAAEGPNRILRGGNWHAGYSLCLSATRRNDDPATKRSIYGFRVCLSAGQP